MFWWAFLRNFSDKKQFSWQFYDSQKFWVGCLGHLSYSYSPPPRPQRYWMQRTQETLQEKYVSFNECNERKMYATNATRRIVRKWRRFETLTHNIEVLILIITNFVSRFRSPLVYVNSRMISCYLGIWCYFAADGHVYSRRCQRRQLYVSFRDLDWQVYIILSQ